MAQIKRVDDGEIFTVASDPVWINSVWECGDQRFTDPSGSEYEPVSSLPLLTPVQFYDALTPQEETAILGSTDPLVITFARRLDRALQTNAPVNPNLPTVKEGLIYLSSTNQQPAVTPAAPYILPERVQQILAGTPQ